MPLFNAVAGIDDALRRVDGIEFACREIIAIDDASTDATLARVRAFAESRPDWRVVSLSRNGGPAVARNAGLAAAHGAYVWCVDWDDHWSPQVLAMLHARALDTGADVTVGRMRSVSPDGRFIEDAEPFDAPRQYDQISALELLLGGQLQGYLWNKLFRRALLGSEPFVPGTEPREDLGALFRILPRLDLLATIPDVVYRYVNRPGSLSKSCAMRTRSLDWVYRQACLAVTEIAHPTPRQQLLLLRFQYEVVLVAKANAASAARRWDPEARRVLGQAAAQVRLRNCLRLAPHFPTTAAKTAVLRIAPGAYGLTQQVIGRIRAILAAFGATAAPGLANLDSWTTHSDSGEFVDDR